MPADANIFQQYLQPPRSALDYANDYATADARRNQNALQALTLQQQTAATGQALEERNALRQIAASSGGSREALIQGMRNSGMPGLMTQADALEQSGAKLAESQSTAAKNNADAGKTTFGTQQDKYKSAVQRMVSLGGPQDAIDDISREVSAGNIPMEAASPLLRSIPTDPAAFNVWKLKMVAGLSDPNQMVDLLKPHIQTSNTGGQTVTQAVDPLTGAPTTTGTLQNTVAPDAQLQASTSRANNSDNIKKDLTVAGVNADGSMTADTRAIVDAIGQYKVAPPNGMALRNPRMQYIMAQVATNYPDYDATQYNAKNRASVAFTTGKQGDALRSISTANAHLDQLGELAAGLNNGDVQIINRVGNAYGVATGQPAPVVFNAVKNVVGQEVVKAIVAGGGSSGERDEAAKAFSDANSPQQLQQVIAHYRQIMGAQKTNLLAQRKAAGLSDSTLPQYADGSAAPKVVDFGSLK